MKNYFRTMTFILLSIFCLTSCSDDDTPNNQYFSTIVGDWQISDYFVTTTNTLTQNGIDVEVVAVSEFVSGDQIITFTSDNQYTSEGLITFTSTTTINGEATGGSTTQSSSNFDSGSWSIVGDQLILIDEITGDIPVTILTLNEQTLEFLIQVDNESLGNPEGPQFGVITGEGNVTYTKL